MAAHLPAGSSVGGVETANRRPWWRGGVLYQIYPRSFADSNADGIGDLPGLIDRLDYLEWLGVDGIWLNPVMPSPNDDWGYDVADYCAVHSELGDLDDVDRLVAEADRRGIRVLSTWSPTTRAIATHGSWSRARPATLPGATSTSGPIPSPTARLRTTG